MSHELLPAHHLPQLCCKESRSELGPLPWPRLLNASGSLTCSPSQWWGRPRLLAGTLKHQEKPRFRQPKTHRGPCAQCLLLAECFYWPLLQILRGPQWTEARVDIPTQEKLGGCARITNQPGLAQAGSIPLSCTITQT